jgi:hypothetical protein
MESGLDPWEMLAGAGTCLDQSHSVLGRVAGLVAITIRSKWVLMFFHHVCDRPYRVITLIPRVQTVVTRRTGNHARTHIMSHMARLRYRVLIRYRRFSRSISYIDIECIRYRRSHYSISKLTYRRYRRSRTGLSISNFRLFDIE